MNIKVYGSEEEPIFKCSDVLIHILKYKQAKDASWFRNIDIELKSMYLIEHGNIRFFNTIGLQWAF